MPRIHPTALVDPKAELADDVEVGAYWIVGPDVRASILIDAEGSGCCS